jgi:hypothetical protein
LYNSFDVFVEDCQNNFSGIPRNCVYKILFDRAHNKNADPSLYHCRAFSWENVIDRIYGEATQRFNFCLQDEK